MKKNIIYAMIGLVVIILIGIGLWFLTKDKNEKNPGCTAKNRKQSSKETQI